MHGNVATSDVVWVLVASAVITAIFAPIAMRMYHRER
jgi:ABC-2 type transport system permease protein